MPFSFIMAIIFAILTLIAWGIHRVSKREYDKGAEELAEIKARYDAAEAGSNAKYAIEREYANAKSEHDKEFVVSRGFAVGLGLVTAIFLMFACLTTVQARSIGVVTAFGKPVGQMDSGLHFKAPWEKVTRLDGTIQTNSAIGAEGDGPESDDYDIGDVKVRLGNESIATVRYTVRWRIKLDTAQALYQEYRSMGRIRESLVTRETFDALNAVLGQFDPLAEIKGDTDAGTSDFGAYADEIKKRIQNSEDGSRIEVISVSLPLVKYDKGTQKKLDLYQTQVASTRVAEELLKTNLAQAKANKALSESISNDPNVLVKQCFDMLDTLADKGKTPAAGFSCWPGRNIDGLIVR